MDDHARGVDDGTQRAACGDRQPARGILCQLGLGGQGIAQDRLLTRARQDRTHRLNGQGMALGRAGRGQGLRNQQPIDAGQAPPWVFI